MPFPQYGKARTLLELTKVKEFLGIAPTDTTHDAALTAAMPMVTDMFENHCKRGLAYDDAVTEEFHGVSWRIPLFRYPVDSVTEYTLDGVAATLPPVDQQHGYIRSGRLGSEQVVRVTYIGGYPLDEVPYDLADAYSKCCADFAGVPYTAGGTSSGSPLKSLGLGSGALTVQFDTGAAAASAYDASAVPALLKPYFYTLENYRMKDYV